mmetsp:Transcript_53638/g.96745  ORF Transcript_53638/g.96745 Transcript_53638/m.96745 type:complete len:224 (+) Transcript_53638:26-697(+)
MTDSAGAESISGMDLANKASNELVRDSAGLQFATTLVMLLGISMFSLVLLNLTIGMYAKYYELQEPVAHMELQQYRASFSVRILLRPAWLRDCFRHERSTSRAAVVCLLGSVVVLGTYQKAELQAMQVLFPYVPGAGLGLLLLAIQDFLLINDEARDGRHRYLWVCYRSDYCENYFMNPNAEITRLQDAERRQSEAVMKLAANVKRLERELHHANHSLRSTSW